MHIRTSSTSIAKKVLPRFSNAHHDSVCVICLTPERICVKLVEAKRMFNEASIEMIVYRV